ncbi:MAG: hypothetical protein LRY36_01220 [Alphaproteobacteria bacterium]|nr:hypothetical protein [Alphaproteobacteria bacterium]MCD8566539.1 hypothetical protein [Alphaproteobacteria bacterium]
MMVKALMTEIKNHGLHIQSINGSLHVQPRDRITDHIRTQIQNLKPALVDFLEAYEERAAIMEFDAGLSKGEAEAQAERDVSI